VEPDITIALRREIAMAAPHQACEERATCNLALLVVQRQTVSLNEAHAMQGAPDAIANPTACAR
jgi:hypothetical protein